VELLGLATARTTASIIIMIRRRMNIETRVLIRRCSMGRKVLLGRQTDGDVVEFRFNV